MNIIAFIGPSGTGKSHRALVVAHDYNIECIIDDGILIYQNRIVAGSSAKKEPSRLKAVRRAIFQDPKQVSSVQEALSSIKPESLLILGTSENMVRKITAALGLPLPSETINIADVATDEEIAKAQQARLKEGKHIIPVPTMELKPHFKGYVIDPIKSIFRKTANKRKEGMADNTDWYEKSVVRPSFSYYGRLTFSDSVVENLIRNGAKKINGVIEIDDLKVKKGKKGTNGLYLDFSLILIEGYDVCHIMKNVKRSIQSEIEYTTGMSLERLQMTVKDTICAKAHI